MAVVLVFAAWHRHAQPEHASARAGAGAPAGVLGRAAQTGRFAFGTLFPAGLEQSYDFLETTRIATSAGQTITQLELRGPLRLSGLQATPQIVVRGEFMGSVSVAAGSDPAAAAGIDLSAALQRPFILEFSLDGHFQRALGDPATPPFLARVWIALGEYLQLVDDGRGGSWQTHESDATGAYVAAYQLQGQSQLMKHKLRYETLTAKALASYDVLASSATFALDSAARLQGARLEEHTRASPGAGPLPAFDGSTQLTLKRSAFASRQDQLASWRAQAANATPLAQLRTLHDARARDQAQAASLAIDDVFDRLALFNGESLDAAQRDRAGRAFVALTAQLREDPKALAMVRAHLEQHGPLTETLLAALRDASTPASQALLAQMCLPASGLTPEQRMEAARSLSRVSTPSAETVVALKALRSDPDVGTQAVYGLGSVLHRVQDRDPVLAQDVRQTLADQLAQSSNDAERAAVLTALGNAGDASSLALIRAQLGHDSPAVRAAAVQGLRRIPGAEADQLLGAACADAAADVRFSAVDAIRERDASPTLAHALTALTLEEPEFQVRARAVNILAQWLPELPEIADTLRLVASQDQHADLRGVAERALALAH